MHLPRPVAATRLSLLFAALWDRRAMFVLPLSYLWVGAVWCLAIGLAREWLVTPESRRAARERSFSGPSLRSGDVLQQYLERVFDAATPAPGAMSRPE